MVYNRFKVSDEIRNSIREGFIKGTLKVGDRLPSEDQLAARFKVSKATVREALSQMESESLVEKRRGLLGGSYLIRPRSEKMGELVVNYYRFGTVTPEELVAFREILEPPLAAVAAIRRTEEDLEKMRSNIEEVEAEIRQGRKDPKKALEFHLLIADACHNRLISAIMKALARVFEEILSLMDITLEESRLDIEYNKQFYEYILHQDREGAEQTMVQHFSTFKGIVTRNRSIQGT